MAKYLEVERYCIATILKYPLLIADILPFINEGDFNSKLNRTVFSVMLGLAHKHEDINELIIAEKITNLGITFPLELDGHILDYLESIKLISLSEKGGMDFFKQLKKNAVKREIADCGRALIKEMNEMGDASIEEILGLADRVYSTKIGSFENSVGGKDFSDIYEELEQIVEEIGNNPQEDFGMMGPFNRINEVYGSLLRPGNITCIGARQNMGKSSLGHYYLTKVSDKYGVPILHLDAGEMTEFELQMRAVVVLCDGKVPMNAIENGEWRKSPTMTALVRGAWDRMKKGHYKCFYKNIGGLTPDEICSVIRRFYIGKAGRGNQFMIHYDYLKSFESFGVNSPEWQQMGYFVQKLKTLITSPNGVPVPIWTSLQLNKGGIVGNKSMAMIDDTENTFSISDRIIQQVSHAFLFRKKSLEELHAWPNRGNSKLINVKKRHLGRDWQAAINPVRMPDGTLQDNYFHMNASSFIYNELGDLATTANTAGKLVIQDTDEDSEPPDVPRKSGFDDADLIMK